MKWRHYLLVGFFMISIMGLLSRVAYLSVTERRDFLKQRGEAIAVRTVSIPAHRGVIYDRHRELLAISTPVHSIWIDPSETTLSNEQLVALGQVLRVSPAALERRVARSGKRFAYLRRQVSPATNRAIRELDIAGVRSLSEYRRFYPAAETTAHVVGMTNVDDIGQEGAEFMFDGLLKGKAGSKRVLLDNHRRTVEELGIIELPHFGDDITVSLDLRLQFSAYRELKSAVAHNNAESGSLVMLKVDTGEILALANQPSYNPNNVAERTSSGVRNRAVTDMYEPGSTVKPLAALAALESGRFAPTTAVDTSPGYVAVGRKLIEDPSNRGVLTLSEVLAKSSQVGITKIALDLPEDAVFDALVRAGFGEPPGSGLPGETLGVLTAADLDKPIGRATLAYGYGVTVTPMQLARCYQVLASGGVRHSVSVLRQTTELAGIRVFDERHVRQVSRMLEQVVSAAGTAPKAKVRGYRVAGKTGTTRKVSDGGYDDGRHVALFAGFAPAADPKIVVVVVINEPRGTAIGGGSVAAPVFARVMARALRILGVAPDHLAPASVPKSTPLAQSRWSTAQQPPAVASTPPGRLFHESAPQPAPIGAARGPAQLVAHGTTAPGRWRSRTRLFHARGVA